MTASDARFGCDILVIGGGPAGTSAAIRLARQGRSVTLYEKERFPRTKLCGGFISGEALPELAGLGVLKELYAAGAQAIRRVVLASPRGAEAVYRLPQPALSVSRRVLDAILMDEARRSGVEVHEGDDGWPHAGEARCIIVAAGRQLDKPDGRSYYGIQSYFEDAAGIGDQVELDLLPGGYVGLNRQEGGRVNVCALVSGDSLRRWGPDLDAVLRQYRRRNLRLDDHLAGARRVAQWKAVGPVRMGLRRLTEAGTFYVGDAAFVADPFVGEGMGMALLGSRLLAQALRGAEPDPARRYERLWHRAFDRSARLQPWLRRAAASSVLQEAVVRAAAGCPSLLGWLTDHTRPRRWQPA